MPDGTAAMKEAIRAGLRSIGLDVRGHSFGTSPDEQFRTMFERHRIDLVLDVGANEGQFSEELRRKVQYKGRIVSFEPLAAAHTRLVRSASRDALWQVAPRVAIGAHAGTVALHVAGNSQSSSVLKMMESHASAAPDSRYVGEEIVAMSTLDAAAQGHINGDCRIFLKVDTQGYEAEVLRGAAGTLAKVVGIQMEMSLTALYAGQPLMRDLWQLLQEAGFELWSLSPVFVDPQSGRLLQVDATFFRTGAADS